MKKMIPIVLSVIMALSLITPAFAVESQTTEKNPVNVSRYIDENNSIVRTFDRSSSNIASRSISNSASVKAEDILSALGMEKMSIQNLSDSERDSINNSNRITSVTSYVKVDEDGNATYLSEEDTFKEVEALLASGYMGQKTKTDTYMRVWHAISYLGNANYQSIVDARWLTMPYFRGRDAIGASMQDTTITPGTQEGYFSYDYRGVSATGNPTNGSSGNIRITSFDTVTDGTFDGCAGFFVLPSDSNSGTTTRTISNLFAHMSFKGHFKYEDLASWRNSKGTYLHTRAGISASASLTINSGSGAIDLTGVVDVDPRTADLEIHYVP